MEVGVSETLEDRVEALEAGVEGAGYAITLLIGLLSPEQRAVLQAELEPLQRRLIAEAPRAGEVWPSADLRGLSRGVALIEEALLGGALFEA